MSITSYKEQPFAKVCFAVLFIIVSFYYALNKCIFWQIFIFFVIVQMLFRINLI